MTWRRHRVWTVLLAAVVVAAMVLLISAPQTANAQLFGISEQQEIQLGRQVERELSQHPGFVDDASQTEYVRTLGLELAHVSERPNLPWTYHIVKDDTPNAEAAPGGFIFVTSGLLTFVQSKDELAFVLAHETTHVAHRHAVDLAQKDMAMQFGILLLSQFAFGGNFSEYQLAEVGRSLLDAKYSRAKEAEADHYGVIYTQKAGYDPEASLAFFERLEATDKTHSNIISHAFEDHPDTSARIAALQVELRQMGYDVPGPAVAPAIAAPATSSPSSGASSEPYAQNR